MAEWGIPAQGIVVSGRAAKSLTGDEEMMMNDHHPKGGLTMGNERGVTLVVAVLVMITATLLGIAAVMSADIEVRMSGNQRCLDNAFYAADAGIDRGVAWLLDLGLTPPAKSDLPTMDETHHVLESGNPSCYSSYRITDVEYESLPPPGWEVTMFKRQYYRVNSVGRYEVTLDDHTKVLAEKEIEVLSSYVFPKE
jgi:hypothetical protein